MTLDQFNHTFKVTDDQSANNPPCSESVGQDVRELVSVHGGKTFNHGLYRILRSDQLGDAKATMERFSQSFEDVSSPSLWIG